ncbi:uncharacterized protein LOC108144111, partial [Drosophila elegans]|uniref:uncharacterized protein LOC108144111 n=1 Tax=Drosophila elegans TaxID=30023 RepID=UPI001BC848B6
IVCISLAMNILKKSHVLNQNCLRDKIQELSPLLRNLDWPANKDSVFRATWSYYASGCQERLTSIRRRIEQNARIVAPNKRISAPLPVELKLPFTESQLKPGLDADEHIYRELVSCFRNAEGTASTKKTPQKRSKIQRHFDMSKFSTPEQWINWKLEEQQVGQLLKQSFDPYLKEEMSKKLQHLKKLTKRTPLLEVPNQKELVENPKVSHSKKRKSRQKYIDETDKYKPNFELRKTKSFTNLDENKLSLSSKKAPTKLAAIYELPINLRKNDTKLAEKYEVHSYASEMSCFQSYPDWFQTNELDRVFIETVVNKKEPKEHKEPKEPKESKDSKESKESKEPKKIKKTIKRRVVETMEVEKTPSRPIKIACSLCNLVRRRQSELRPYMQRMQLERQRLELKTYYTQKLLKCRQAQEQNVQEQKRACAREVLARCYQTLNLCQQILEQRRLKKCQLQQSEQIRKLST